MKKTERQRIKLAAGDALVVLDAPNDSLPDGNLAVPRSDTIIPVLNRYLAEFARRQLPIFATHHWPLANHGSVPTHGSRWPASCVADSKGEQFVSQLILPPWTVGISKGVAADGNGDSGFAGTDLEKRLRGHGIHRLFVGGLGTYDCVLNTVKDALARGFSVFLLRDAIGAARMKPDHGRDAETSMSRLGAVPITLRILAP